MAEVLWSISEQHIRKTSILFIRGNLLGLGVFIFRANLKMYFPSVVHAGLCHELSHPVDGNAKKGHNKGSRDDNNNHKGSFTAVRRDKFILQEHEADTSIWS